MRTCDKTLSLNSLSYRASGGTDSTGQCDGAAQDRRAKGTSDTGKGNRPSARVSKPGTPARAASSVRTVMRLATIIVIVSFFTTLLPGDTGIAETRTPAQANAIVSSFGTPVMVNDVKTGDQAAPIIAKMPGQKLIVVWQDQRSGNQDIYSAVSQNNGTSYAANKRVDDTTDTSQQMEPAVAFSKNGTILLTWQDNRKNPFDYDVYFSKSLDGGVTFTPNVKVDDSNGAISWQERPSIAAISGDVIYIAWTDDRTHNMRIRGAYSTNLGATWSPSVEIEPGGLGGQTGVTLVTNGERIFASYMDNVSGTPHPYICVSTNGGRSFSTPVRVDIAAANSSQRGINIAPRPDGGVAAVWEDSRNGDWDIYATIIDANCVGSGIEYRVDDDMNHTYQYSSSVTSDRAGNVYVVWEDERSMLYAIRFAYLKVGSPKFTASIQVSAPRADDIQRRASVITTDPGRVVVAWQDDRANTYDIYTASGWFPNLFDLQLVAGWNFVTVSLVGWNYKASTLGLKTGDVVNAWNSSSGYYDRTYTVGVSPIFKDFTIVEGAGYWIYAKVAETINLYGTIPAAGLRKQILVPQGGGWVAFGFESLNSTRRASEIPKMFNVSGGLTLVTSYDPSTGKYKSYRPGVPFTDFKLVPGRALWVWCTSSGTLTYDP